MTLNMPTDSAIDWEWWQYIILHEFGHALGMEHEHQSPKCPHKWNYNVIRAQTGDNETYNNWKPLKPADFVSCYDPLSIMHYPVQEFFSDNDPSYSLPHPTVLSKRDKEFLMAVYPNAKTSGPKQNRLPSKRFGL
jgi:hypothetical protein